MNRGHDGKEQFEFVNWSTEVAGETQTPDFEDGFKVKENRKRQLQPAAAAAKWINGDLWRPSVIGLFDKGV